jgi:RNA recognition motif-containing protein
VEGGNEVALLPPLSGPYRDGEVESARVIVDRMSGRSKGFGFVELVSDEDGEKAIQALDGTDFGGRKLMVSKARPQEERPRRDFGGDRGGDRGGYNRF